MHAIFGDVETITGVATYSKLLMKHTGKPIYFFGEHHNFNGVKGNPYIVDVFPLNATIIAELQMNQVLGFVQASMNRKWRAKRPLVQLAVDWIKNPSNCPKVIITDVRRDFPLNILESITDYNSFVALYVLNSVEIRTQPEKYREFHHNAKLFERDVFQHFSSRLAIDKFIMSIIHPDKNIPVWYKKWCLLFARQGESIDDIWMKTSLKSLREKNKLYYNVIMAYVREEVDSRVMDVESLSSAMDSLENERNTESEEFITSRHDTMKYVFIALFALFMDVAMLIHILSYPEDSPDHCIVLAGDAHIFAITEFFKRHDLVITDAALKMNAQGYIRLNEHTHLQMPQSQQKHS